jgi:hypothetical protein
MKTGIYFTGIWNDDDTRFFVMCRDIDGSLVDEWPDWEERAAHVEMAHDLKWELWDRDVLMAELPFNPETYSIPHATQSLSHLVYVTT